MDTCRVLSGMLLVAAVANSPARADPFQINAQIFSPTGQILSAFSDSFTQLTQAIQVISPVYQSFLPVAAQVNYLGVPVTLAYPFRSTTLIFTIPGLNFSQQFTGLTRQASAQQLLDFLEQNSDLQNRLQRYLAGNAPTSPLAGNPGSLQGQLVSNSFANSALNTSSNAQPSLGNSNSFGISVSGGFFNAGGFSGQTYTIPISYVRHFADDRVQLQVNLPLTYQSLSGAAIYGASLGIGLQYQVFPGTDWYLTPTVSLGTSGSSDLEIAGAMSSYALSSRYTYHASPALDLTLGDMIGYVDTVPISIAKYSANPNIQDVVLKNGVIAEYSPGWNIHAVPISIRAGAAYTQMFGTKLYVSNYADLFFDIGPAPSAGKLNALRLGLTATLGRNYQAVNVGVGYKF